MLCNIKDYSIKKEKENWQNTFICNNFLIVDVVSYSSKYAEMVLLDHTQVLYLMF